MLDLIDILQGRFNQTNPGLYYEKRPRPQSSQDLNNSSVGQPLDYEVINPYEYHYRSLLGNMTDTKSITTAIKTKDQYDYRVGGFIVLSDGRTCQIDAVTVDTGNTKKQARRVFPIPLGTEYVIRLIEVDNARGVV